MASISPFKAFRAEPTYVEQFSASAADADVRDDDNGSGKENPYSFLHILNPQLFSSEKLSSEEIYKRAVDKLHILLDEKILTEEAKPALYIYRQVKENNVYTSIIGLASIAEYNSSGVKKHELTRTDKESKITSYFKAVGANGNPVLLTYPDSPSLNLLIQELVEDAPEYGFMGEDGIEHALWVVSDEKSIKAVQEEFAKVKSLYIADGHHRCASLGALYPEVEHFMACFISANQLNIHGFHRYVKDLNNLSPAEFLKNIEAQGFEVDDITGREIVNSPGTINLFLDEKWYSLKIPEKFKNISNPKQALDVYILDKYIFGEVLGIKDTRSSNKISYVNGDISMDVLLAPVHKAFCSAVFALSPVTVEEIIQVSDYDETMPPKSTWIEPKLRSGLLVHRFNKNV